MGTQKEIVQEAKNMDHISLQIKVISFSNMLNILAEKYKIVGKHQPKTQNN